MSELNKLKAPNIKTLVCDPGKKVKKFSDGGGLYLWVKPNNSKQWYFHYKYNGKPKDYYLGTWPKLSALEARKKRELCQNLISEKTDPYLYFNQIKENNLKNSQNTFKLIAEKWLNEVKAKISESTYTRYVGYLNNDILPVISNKPIKDITKNDVLEIIRNVEIRTIGDTNERVLVIIHRVFEYAIDLDICEKDPTVSIKKHLRKPIEKHYPAITDMKEFAEFLNVLDSFKSKETPSVFYCLKLSVLVAARSEDIRNMKWGQIDFDKKNWCYTVNKIKKEFVCPLSKQAIEILKTMKELTYRNSDSFVFPGIKEPNRAISDGAFHMFFVRSGYQGKQSHHGFRATMQTQLLELGYPKDWTEIALSHNIAKYGGAYDRAAYVEPRRKMMQAWADYLDEIKKPGADIEAITKKYTFRG